MGRKTSITRDEFIKRANEIHNNKYDYSKVEYTNTSTKVCIVCPIHGEFWQKPCAHLLGAGCARCARVTNGEKRRITADDFIRRSQKKHGNKYDYSKCKYVNNQTKVCIICPEHGEFWQLPINHLNGQGCPKCQKSRITKTKEQFIKDAVKLYGLKYDYSKVEYVNSKTKVCIICPEYGEFWITPNNFLRGHNCNGIHTEHLNTESFIEKAKKIHGDKYDYSKVEYVNSETKICITCPEHGEFWQTPINHLRGHGCKKCTPNSLKNNEYFIQKAIHVHGDRYDYSKVEYHGNKRKVCIICPEHGEFWQAPSTHLIGCGCPSCNNSKLELEVFNTLRQYDICFEQQKTFKWLKTNSGSLKLDFYIESYNLAIECQGLQHFETNHFFGGIEGLVSTQYRDYVKYDKCKKQGINVLYYIPYEYEKYKNEFYEEKYCFKNINELTNFIKDYAKCIHKK